MIPIIKHQQHKIIEVNINQYEAMNIKIGEMIKKPKEGM